jgi:diguanylate cyclase (GGDEF)-like protein
MNPTKQNSLTALELWRNQFRPYFDVFLDAYCVTDSQGTVVEYNIAFTDLVGESHRKIHKIGFLMKLISFENGVDPIKQLLSEKLPLRLDEVKASTRAYPELNLIVGGVPIFGDNLEVIGTLVTIRNVTAETSLLLKYDEKKKDSVTDVLTGLFNKRFMEENISRNLKISIREQKPLTLVIGDIDFFKKVNDTHGHPAGDYVLKLVGNTLKNMLRDTDFAARFGGEEFVVLLSNCPEPGALIFAERFRKTIESTIFIFEGKRIPVTISQGTATFFEGWKEGLDIEALKADLLHRADTALYEAKTSGRNRVCQSPTPKKES